MTRKLFGASAVATWAAVLVTAGSAAATTTLVDQNSYDAGNNIISTLDTGRVSADDFIVPTGKTWTITRVDATGMPGGCVAGETVDVVIYNDAAGLPGTTQSSATVTPTDGVVQTGCNFQIPVSFTLTEGHYWLSVQPHQIWYAETTRAGAGNTVSGYGAAFYDAFGECGTVGWKSAYACASTWGSWYQDYDLMFAIQGTEASADATAPDIAITTPADGATYTLNQSVTADYSCTDSESGVASCAGPVADGDAIDTSTVGSHTFTVNTADNAGNTGSASATYTVVYDWQGFFRPVLNGAVDGAKAGSAIPMKFSLHGDQGLSIFASGYPKSVQVNCTTKEAISGTSAPATGSLSYDAYRDEYSFVWKTSKGWSNTCRRFDIVFADGSTTVHSVFVKFPK